MKTFIVIVGLIMSLCIGIIFGAWSAQGPTNQPTINLPEEFMCWVSDEPNKPDTVLIYQSVSNDSLYINFMPKK